MLFHQRVQVDHGKGAILGIVAEFFCRLSLLDDALEDHAIHRAMSHALFVLHEIGLGVFGEVNRLALSQAVMAYQRRAPLTRPVGESFLISVRAP